MVPPTLPAVPPMNISSSNSLADSSAAIMAADGNSKAVPESEDLGNTQNAGGFHDPFHEDEFDEASDFRTARRKKAKGFPLPLIR